MTPHPSANKDQQTLLDFEPDICDVTHMATILAKLLEDTIGGDPSTETGQRDLHRISDSEVNMLLFAAFQLRTMTGALKDRFYEQVSSGRPKQDGAVKMVQS